MNIHSNLIVFFAVIEKKFKYFSEKLKGVRRDGNMIKFVQREEFSMNAFSNSIYIYSNIIP
ncbi:hypothetical protein HZS_4780 [Henneguya salminicola]|nr:hypothetical protein HZS_4780 [Henneguya salminicola]